MDKIKCELAKCSREQLKAMECDLEKCCGVGAAPAGVGMPAWLVTLAPLILQIVRDLLNQPAA